MKTYSIDFTQKFEENRNVLANSEEEAEKEFQYYDMDINGDHEVEYVSSVEETDEPLSANYLSMIFEEERGKL